MVTLTLSLLLFNICGLLVIYLRLNAYLQLLRRRKLSEAGDVPCDSGIEWTLASRLDNNVSIYTAIDASRFSLRFVADSVPTGAAELMCLLREVDLIPAWNAFCAWGGVLRAASATELWAGAVLALPWPVPRHAIVVHAQLHDRIAEEGCVLVKAATPSALADALPSPLSTCTHSLPIAMSVGRLTPLTPAASGPRTAVDAQVPPLRTRCPAPRPCTSALHLCDAPPLWILALHPSPAPNVQMTIELQGLGWMGGFASGVPQVRTPAPPAPPHLLTRCAPCTRPALCTPSRTARTLLPPLRATPRVAVADQPHPLRRRATRLPARPRRARRPPS